MKKLSIVILLILTPALLTIQNHNTQETAITEQEFDQVIYNWLRTFAEVLQLAKNKHYKIVNLEQAMIKSIDCFLNALDPHSGLLDPKTYQSILESTSGEFFGIGIVIDNTRKSKDKFLLVTDTIPDGPSDKAGIKPLDKIVEIDGQILEGMSTEEATSKLKGERNTKVHVKVLRDNQQDLLSFDITRDVIKEQTSLGFYIPKFNIYYLSLTMFTEDAVNQLERILQQANQKQYKGLILDLRNNSGGLLSAAINIASLFLDKGSLVAVTKDKTNKITEQYVTTRDSVANNTIPIFILINNYTASAAEILAGTLKLHSELLAQQANNGMQKKLLVFLVGSRTFGKGSVQEIIPISNNSAIKITTLLYFVATDAKHNISIQGIGIEPDFVIERCFPPTEQIQWFTKYYGREQTLSNYIKMNEEQTPNKNQNKSESIKSTPVTQKSARWIERAKDMLQLDNQLRETISLINLLHTFQQTCPQNVCTRSKAVEFIKANHVTNDQLDIQEMQG